MKKEKFEKAMKLHLALVEAYSAGQMVTAQVTMGALEGLLSYDMDLPPWAKYVLQNADDLFGMEPRAYERNKIKALLIEQGKLDKGSDDGLLMATVISTVHPENLLILSGSELEEEEENLGPKYSKFDLQALGALAKASKDLEKPMLSMAIESSPILIKLLEDLIGVWKGYLATLE